MTKMNIEVFSDGSELWDDIASGKNKDGAGKCYQPMAMYIKLI